MDEEREKGCVFRAGDIWIYFNKREVDESLEEKKVKLGIQYNKHYKHFSSSPPVSQCIADSDRRVWFWDMNAY